MRMRTTTDEPTRERGRRAHHLARPRESLEREDVQHGEERRQQQLVFASHGQRETEAHHKPKQHLVVLAEVVLAVVAPQLVE